MTDFDSSSFNGISKESILQELGLDNTHCEEIEKEINKLMKDGLIEPASSNPGMKYRRTVKGATSLNSKSPENIQLKRSKISLVISAGGWITAIIFGSIALYLGYGNSS